ncbi:hypothetical protein [Marivita cryptomonadis]|uniref:hypothetical protein n=1 Tax=Marivita cryptomonadis TaxID=505252 RepID=UPI00391B93EB
MERAHAVSEARQLGATTRSASQQTRRWKAKEKGHPELHRRRRRIAALAGHFLDFRSWWLEHGPEENLTPNQRKDLIHLADVLRGRLRLDLDLPPADPERG